MAFGCESVDLHVFHPNGCQCPFVDCQFDIAYKEDVIFVGRKFIYSGKKSVSCTSIVRINMSRA